MFATSIQYSTRFDRLRNTIFVRFDHLKSKATMGSQPSESGFTLVEVLVALVVAALLIAILMDAAVSSKMRHESLVLQTRAMVAANSQIDSFRGSPGIQSATGNSGGLDWVFEETEIARDPRQIYVLVEASIKVGTSSSPQLFTRKKRYLKPLVER